MNKPVRGSQTDLGFKYNGENFPFPGGNRSTSADQKSYSVLEASENRGEEHCVSEGTAQAVPETGSPEEAGVFRPVRENQESPHQERGVLPRGRHLLSVLQPTGCMHGRPMHQPLLRRRPGSTGLAGDEPVLHLLSQGSFVRELKVRIQACFPLRERECLEV